MKTDMEPLDFIIEFYRKVSKRLKEVAEFYRGKDIADEKIDFDKILDNLETVKLILSDEVVTLSDEVVTKLRNIHLSPPWYFFSV